MLTPLRVVGHLLRGRVFLWQAYTNVTWRTCETCLSWHGRIVADPTAFSCHKGCPHELRKLSVWKLAEHREQGKRMAARARAEIRRRDLFCRAVASLATDPEGSLRLFDQAGSVDVYLPEVEALAREQPLTDPALRARLREILLVRWKAKFAMERYERQPELARTEQEAWGVARIKRLLP